MNEKKAQTTQGRVQDVRGGLNLKKHSTICKAVHTVSNAECSTLCMSNKTVFRTWRRSLQGHIQAHHS